MKKNYENPIIEVIKLEGQDVIATSGVFGGNIAGEQNEPWS